MTKKPEELANAFLGLGKFCSSDAHSTYLNSRLAEGGKLIETNGKNRRNV